MFASSQSKRLQLLFQGIRKRLRILCQANAHVCESSSKGMQTFANSLPRECSRSIRSRLRILFQGNADGARAHASRACSLLVNVFAICVNGRRVAGRQRRALHRRAPCFFRKRVPGFVTGIRCIFDVLLLTSYHP